jgi:hypothetical protein
MFKKVVRQGRSERDTEAYSLSYVAGVERCENAAGDFFQQTAEPGLFMRIVAKQMRPKSAVVARK